MTPDTIADLYLAAWNASQADERRSLLAKGWSETARYVDPLMQGQGRDGIAAIIETARTQFPGLAFARTGKIDSHGPFVRFSWALGADGMPPAALGTDVVRLDGEGRIAEVIGFLDAVAAQAA